MESNPENSSNIENGEDMETVTISEVMQSQDSLIEDAYAVLGASDDKNCTYSEGYMRRQALYACLTCVPEAKTNPEKRAGLCLACTFHCHDGHELVELYTKRNFRCDCGNGKFPNTRCNLHPDKDVENENNRYNQNFSGVYCTCARPYPDPDDSIADEMIQCVICEDWFHTRHLGVEVPNGFAEMICRSCVRDHDFLLYYDGLTIAKVSPELNESGDVNIVEDKESEAKPIVEGDCKKSTVKSENVCTKFMKDLSWRQQLCTCSDCMNVYKKENVAFLIDPQDTVQFYEDQGKENAMKREENALNSVDRVPLMEAIAGYNDMKVHLLKYLKKFAENKKVVREEDIREFFSEMNERKKQKTSTIPPHFCR